MALFASGTKMKNLGVQQGFQIMELGDLLYLMMPTEPCNRVIISAHGGHAVLSNTNQFVVPSDVVLRFYSDDTKSVLDPGFNNFYRGEAAPKEIISEGERSFDYLLSKYQGSHGNKSETYDSIAKVISDTIALNARLKADAAKPTTSEKGRARLLNAAAREKVAAVVTIRNRWFKGDATLKLVVNAVKAAAPSIMIFDCLFCRSTMFGGSDAVPIVNRG
jgi:hypothetical protein